MSDGRHLLCIYPWLTWGGADKFNLDMIGCLVARGWRISIATSVPSRHEWRAQFARYTDDIIDLTQMPPDEAPARMLQLIRSRPLSNVLIANSRFGYQLLPYLHAHAPQLVYADYCHVVEGDGHFARISLEHARWIDQQIVASQNLRHWMLARGGDSAKIAVCTINVDTEHWQTNADERAALRAALGLPPDAYVVLYAARLERQKQPLLAMQVLRKVVRRVPDAYVLVAGDGRFGNYVRGFVRWHRLEGRMHVLGTASSTRMRELLAASDIFFLPSAYEGISLAIYEAMALGVVPVSVAAGGQAELVTPDCGVLIEHGPHEGIEYTRALFELHQDAKWRQTMAQTARARVHAHFRLDQMGDHVDALLRQPLAPRSSVAPETARASAQQAIAVLRQESNVHAASSVGNARYTHLIEHGPWWIAPVSERLRTRIRAARGLTD